MAILVDVKGQGKVEFPDGTPKETMLQALRRRFGTVAKGNLGTLEAIGTMATGAIAEPLSGLAGIAGAVLPGKSGQGAELVQATQDALTYQPRTETGQERLQSVGEFLQPVGEVMQKASQNLGDKAYSATGSPALAAAAYSVPTAIAEGIGLKGVNILRKPVTKENLFALRSGAGMADDAKPITSIHELFDYTPQQLSEQLKKSNPSAVVDGVYREQKRAFYTDYMPDGSITMFKNDGTPLKTMSPEEAKRIYRDKILEIELQKPEAQKIIAEREAKAAEYEQAQADNDYRMAHKAPRRGSNPTLDDLSTVFDDIYGDRAYQLNTAGLPFDRKAIDIIRSMKGNPDKEITIYRALPKGVKDINAGDWVTTTKEYAEQHAKYDPNYVVISKKVKAKDIVTDGNSIHEFGYDPTISPASPTSITVYRGVGEGSDDSIVKWVSPDKEIAKGYAKARGGKVESETVTIRNPAMMGKASRRDTPSSLVSSLIRDTKNLSKEQLESAKSARKEFLDYFGSEPVNIVDLWADESAKAVTKKLLQSLGYDAIKVTEQGAETYGILK